MSKLRLALVVLITCTFAALCPAAPVVATGELSYGEFGGNPDDNLLDWKIDRITFTVTAGTSVNFDALVYEETGFDLNGDGEITGVDFQMSLFNAGDALLYFEDDGPLGDDGSIAGVDGNFDYHFITAGTYYLAVGALVFSEQQGIAGYRPDVAAPAQMMGSDHFFGADWQVTLTPTNGEISNVLVSTGIPEPASLALVALGSVAMMRRRTR